MWQAFLQPTTLEDALSLRAEHPAARVLAGGTDLVVELSHGVRPTDTLIDLNRVPGLKTIHRANGWLELGALTTHNDVLASADCQQYAPPLVQACAKLGAPQLRAVATVAGNLVTASPANDTISALVALDARLLLRSTRGERELPLDDFYLGVRRTVLATDELVTAIRIPEMTADRRGVHVKLGPRRAQAISIVHLALVLTMDTNAETVRSARIALGSVAPTIVRASEAETFLTGQRLDPDICREAGKRAAAAATPISDVRGSAAYRQRMVETLTTRALRQLAGLEPAPAADPVVLLDTSVSTPAAEAALPFAGAIETTIDGAPRQLTASTGRTLLQALRDEAGLTGAKEGCGEGECGACTVWLDDRAVMSCLVPAPRAHGARVTTIEGLAATSNTDLHPLQRAFIEQGAVQCGFCIPGMVMAGAKLLAEHPSPDLATMQTGLSGNLCRCTGYRKILDALRAASGARS